MKCRRLIPLLLGLCLLTACAGLSGTEPTDWTWLREPPQVTLVTERRPEAPEARGPETEAPGTEPQERSTAQASTEPSVPVTSASPTEAQASGPDTPMAPEPEPQEGEGVSYVLNTNTKRFHLPSCASVGEMKEENKAYFTGSREELLEEGYVPCKRCNP